MKKVMVGMSGGVDSSVSALILREKGYDVTGVTLKLFSDDDIRKAEETQKTCCALSDVEDAKSVAHRLGFEHFTFNFRDNFKKYVMNKFVNSYFEGATPNPCIECNRHIKFDKMLQRANELGFDYIATGHYAVTEYDEKTGRYLLKRATDRSKDQTYVLYSLTQYQLAHTLFPLGTLTKSEVRSIAENAGLVNSNKPDSQDICFVPDGDYASFIKEFTGKDSEIGDFKDINGKIIGKHKGIINYTIGQRKGLGIAIGKPAYVVDKDIETNSVIIGDEKDLYKNELIAEDVNLISVEDITEQMRITAKTRYSQIEQPAVLMKIENGEYKVVFDNPQRAITKGQAVVFYDNDIVVGGGTIK